MTDNIRPPQKLFGPNGIQGIANKELLTPEFILRVGQVAGIAFRNNGPGRVIIGKDPRRPNYMIEYILTGAFTAVGLEPLLTGPIPSPGVAMLTASMRAELGVMVTGSGETYEHSGIKFFGPDGSKISREQEEMIELMMNEVDLSKGLTLPSTIASAKRIDEAQGRYITLAKKEAFPDNLDLDGIRVVVDCANGASYEVAPQALEELGAEVFAIGNHPDGYNINHDCGYAHPNVLSAEVNRLRAEIGIALDGDGEHVLIVDELRQKFDKNVLNEYLVPGDGLMTALRVLGAMREKNQKASEFSQKPVSEETQSVEERPNHE